MKKRVLYVMQSLGMGGVSSVILNYYKEITQDIIADFAVTDKVQNVPLSVVELIYNHGGKIFFLPHFAGLNMFLYYYKISKIIKNGNYNIIHDNDKYFGFLSLKPAKNYNVRIRIAHVHNCVAAEEKQFLHRTFIRVASRLTQNVATDKLACSQEAGNSMYLNKDFIVLNNSISPDKFKFSETNRKKYRKHFQIESKDKVLITVARNDALKRYDFAFTVFDRLCNLCTNNNYRYIIIGLFESELSERDSFAFSCISEEARKRIVFLGRCFNTHELLSMADGFILTSEHEGFGISLIEAQANDLFCFASNAIPQSTKVSDLVMFLPCLDSPDLWAREIDKTLSEYRRHGLGFDSVCQSSYTIEKSKKILLDLYCK